MHDLFLGLAEQWRLASIVVVALGFVILSLRWGRLADFIDRPARQDYQQDRASIIDFETRRLALRPSETGRRS